ncbi:type II secretion system major pseudopilin GspG [Sphingorhabdus sp. Alg239-R122]|uniref:type II secretion system major pseudopilin GspG n=1 Tax=Sphingorhabdus sp. Alg239-R122 TaxID=2305989 RepID=UPI001967A209|nr:type II secretion system major pseudopilin GspG [Sphingorhabdus sp. Alg239-R122]
MLSQRLAELLARMTHTRRKMRKKEQGFTLVELMVVIFIIGLLATVVILNVLPSQDQAMVTKAESDIATMGQALEMYRLDNLNYPSTGEGLQALRTPPASLTRPERYRAGGYIQQLPDDPWGRPYQYSNPGRGGTGYDIYSLGADGAPGGDGLNADINSGGN